MVHASPGGPSLGTHDTTRQWRRHLAEAARSQEPGEDWRHQRTCREEGRQLRDGQWPKLLEEDPTGERLPDLLEQQDAG